MIDNTESREHPILFSAPMVVAILEGRKTQTRRVGDRYKKWRVGDRLWVKEAWNIEAQSSKYRSGDDPTHEYWIGYRAGGVSKKVMFKEKPSIPFSSMNDFGRDGTRNWKSGLFMPRWASRISLEIEGVRHERLCDISKEDADAEGVGMIEFPWLWDKINGKKPGMSWLGNPLVWVIQFQKL